MSNPKRSLPLLAPAASATVEDARLIDELDPSAPREWRPVTRGDCLSGMGAARPCPYVSCKYHLYLDVNARTGSIKLNFPDMEVDQLADSCTLDIADRELDGASLGVIGGALRLVRERIRQIEARSLARLRKDVPGAQFVAYADRDRLVSGRKLALAPPRHRASRGTRR